MLQATFRQLQTFIVVAETGSFSAAADDLMISQQAISNQIRALERRLGQGLFVRRSGVSPVLSDRGLALLERAPNLLAQAEDVERLVGSVQAEPVRARVGVGEHIMLNVLTPRLPSLQFAHPDLQIEFVPFSSPATVMAAVRDGQVDLAYYTLAPDELNSTAEIIVEAEAGLFAAPSHPLAQKLPLEPRSGLPLIMPLNCKGVRSMSERLLTRAGFPNSVVVTRAQTAMTRLQLAVQGVGACILFKEFAANEVRNGRLVDLGVPFEAAYRCAIRRPGALEFEHLQIIDSFIVRNLRELD
ncbi:MAG: LysR family transcriptional regulator [Caulobacteraceae bacterium]